MFRRACLWTGFLAFAAIAFGPQPAQGAVTEAWVQRYGSEAGSEDYAAKVVTDAAGNVIVAGTTVHSRTGSGSDMLVIKYSGAGVPLWTNRYDGWARGVAVDASGNVFVTGVSAGSGAWDYATIIAYSGAGAPLWTNRYNGGASAVAVDASGNVFVTGYSVGSGSSHDYATFAYSGAGVPLWTNRYNGPAYGLDEATAVALDRSGNVFVTGASYGGGRDSNYDYATIAYSGAGVPLWTNRYIGPYNSYDGATALAVDANGNVVVTGFSGYETQFGELINDYTTIAYSGAGVHLWTRRYTGPGNGDDYATAVAVDASGNVFVTGSSVGSAANYDCTTVAYSSAGVPLWTRRYTGSYDARAVAVDGSGNVFVTGSYATIAYSGAGAPLWTNSVFGTAIALGSSGNVFVTGNSWSGGDSDYATIAYSSAGVMLWTNRYGGRRDASDIANAMAVDASGNVFVTGTSATIAYSGVGVPLWTNYGGSAVAVDGRGNLFVTGSPVGVESYGNATVAYSGAGAPLWTNYYNYDNYANYNSQASGLAVDGSGNVFVTGSSVGSGGDYAAPLIGRSYKDYATIAYSGAGVPLWTNRYNGTGNGWDIATAVAADASGNVFVTGSSFGNESYYDYATIAYSATGLPLWTNRYNGPGNFNDQATAVAVDASGNVVVTGTSDGSGGYSDYATIKYSGAGVPLWTNCYNGPGDFYDQATAVAVDGRGNVFVTGYSGGTEGTYDYVTIAYSGAGVALWTNRYNADNYSAHASAAAVDGSGNVFVTGSAGYSFGDYAIIAYSGAGAPLWTNRYNGAGYYAADLAQTKPSLAIGSGRAVYVTTSAGLFLPDFVTVKYVWRPDNEVPAAAIDVSPLLALPTQDASLFVLAPNNTTATVVLDASRSSDPDNDPLQFSWYADGQTNALATGAIATLPFAVGQHTVALVVSDAQDTGTAQVRFEVITPASAVDRLAQWLNEPNLETKNKQPLLATLSAAMSSFDRGNFTAALNQLTAFQNKVRAQIAPSNPALAELLTDAAQRISNGVNGP